MALRNRPGTCLLCRAVVSKKMALQHGENCLRSSGWPVGLFPSFIIRVEDRHDPTYWLIVLARHGALLSDLDCLIRDVWVECCDHLSCFTIGNKTYMNTNEEMDIPLADLITAGSLFSYQYDFGSTTELRLKVLGETPVMPPEGQVCLTARNNRPSFPCSICGKEAELYVTDSEEEEHGEYCCLGCTIPLDDVYIQLIENSPRSGVCAYSENPDTSIKWYPPGWTVDDIISEDIQQFMEYLQEYQDEDEILLNDCELDEEMVVDMINTVSADIGKEITGFIKEERAAHGEDAGALAEEIVATFSTMLYGYYETKIEDWDAPLMRTTLLEDATQNPSLPDEWLENTVPILCRFLAYMEKSSRIRNAADLIIELQDAEPLFREAVMSCRDAQDLTGSVTEQEVTSETDDDDFYSLCKLIVQELKQVDQTDPDSKDYTTIIENLFGKSMEELREDAIRYKMISDRCDDFCNQLDNEDITERCREIVTDMAAHPEEPLSRGDDVLWSAAIVYAACREEGIVGKAKGGSPLARDICGFYHQELSSVRNKVTVLKKYIAECDEMKPSFSI